MDAMRSVLETFVALLVSLRRSRRPGPLERIEVKENRASGSDLMTRCGNVIGYF
jgi:hypothetical protein